MVLIGRRTALTPALVVPDEQTWTLAGADPAAHGLEPVFAPAEARRLLVPEHLPEPLAGALAARAGELPADVTGLDGGHDAHDHAEHASHDMHGDHGGHGHHGDHGDMMAIVGEPSADGLVMEPIELRYGPLFTPLPGGLAVDVTLDGDVVCEARVDALLEGPPDPLAAAAWRVAVGRGEGDAWMQIASVERERAVSHLAWLRAFGRLLGWQPLVDRCTQALLARGPVEAVVSLTASRWLRLRAGGRAIVTAEQARERGLRGPAARASGLVEDGRLDDPRYRQLGFEPVVHSGGDALARARVRALEAAAALDLAEAASRASAEGTRVASSGGADVEGPRGPVTRPGATAAREVAAESMVGLEWSAALVALASFDLSPWRVPE